MKMKMKMKELNNREKTLFKYNFPKTLANIEHRANIMLPKKVHAHGVETCLIIDGMNIAYQAFYAYFKLSYNKKSTSILYGFINILRPIIRQFEPGKVIICWDGEKHPERMKTIPGYKMHREKTREPKQRKRFLNQIKKTQKLLYYLGIPQVRNEKVEGDDMIYLVTQRMKMLYRIIIVSADKDFKQLIDHDVNVYHPRTKYIENLWAFTANNYGIEVSQYKDFLCLTGDASDDIPGYPNIGEKRAAALLSQFYTIRDYLESKKLLPGLMDKEKLKKVYLRNNKMINLAYFNRKFNKNARITYINDKQYPKYQENKFREYCLSFGLKTSVYPNFLEPFLKINSCK